MASVQSLLGFFSLGDHAHTYIQVKFPRVTSEILHGQSTEFVVLFCFFFFLLGAGVGVKLQIKTSVLPTQDLTFSQ